MRIACSWNLPAGQDAVIAADLWGTRGGASLRNVAGSFHDLEVFRHHGTATERLCSPPDAWGGRAAVDWLARLAGGAGFHPAAGQIVTVAEVLDRIHAGGGPAATPIPRPGHATAGAGRG